MDTNFFERLEALNAKKAELQKEYDGIRSDAKEMAIKLVKQFGFAAAEIGSGEAVSASLLAQSVPRSTRTPPLNPALQKIAITSYEICTKFVDHTGDFFTLGNEKPRSPNLWSLRGFRFPSIEPVPKSSSNHAVILPVFCIQDTPPRIHPLVSP